jgi:hypothetical protein
MDYKKATLLCMLGIGMTILNGCGKKEGANSTATTQTPQQNGQMKAKQEAFFKQQAARSQGTPAQGAPTQVTPR